ncbi:glycosyltransferase [Novosphingobium beihaiensis]|uniref:Glycosyltransferase n=1 Tax=Novosphingobium beihaiensis TaxID=2930389 RepID=A0ABT0BTI3_9SPHN|nr:glycosyltransferase [Novosphingobium beihaiensis]MCJ2188349.1 glycosyltransferase [Novosphingobium beihaiensis]
MINTAIQQTTHSLPTVLHQISRLPRQIKDGAIRYDGLFDIFPESYWSRFTLLHSVTLRCHLSGPARLRLIRRQVDGSDAETLLCDVVCNDVEAVLSTPLAAVGADESYLLLEVVPEDAYPEPLLSAIWETSQPAVRTPCVGLTITTFNREPFLVANLTRLHGRMAGGRAIVVNHGPPGLEARLKDQLPENPAIRWIDQENSGGAGGFTRGMMEHRTAGDITHVLLMDDDIDLPEDIIERTTAILSYSHPEVCLGGAMFDYHHRNRLFSAGDMLLPGGFAIGHVAPPEGCDISTPEGVDFLARVHRPDFNGWWCFAFPLQALDWVGLPMPCFIRGDDVEFGYRLKRAGMPTLGWPGLAVWHMPFADKSAPWHMFYDRRNSLFANARHRRVGRLAAISKLVGGFAHHLLRYDYDRVQAMTLGIAAFNMGASKMANWSHRDHAMMIATTSTMQIQDIDTAETLLSTAQLLKPQHTSGLLRSLRMVGRMILDLTGLPTGKPTAYRLAPGTIWRPDFTRRPALVIESDTQGRTARIYRRNPAESRRATLRCIKALFGMVLHFHQHVPQGFPSPRQSTSSMNSGD